MMHVITIETPSLGDRSYVVHDGEVAVVIDPPRDIDRVEAAADSAGVRIVLIAETHVHNDYVSGGLTLSRVTAAQYVNSADEHLTFDHRGVGEGDQIVVGDMTVQVVATPGHTPHHLTYVVRSSGSSPAVFTGGSLLYGTVGRTDLISGEATDGLTRQQYQSARKLAQMLPDDANVYPTHGFGSFCASAQSDGDSDGTLGTERLVNLALTVDDENDFVNRVVSGLTAYPAYYSHMAPLNRAGPTAADLSAPAEVDPVELARRIHRGEWVVDLRQRRLFATEHVFGTISIELADAFSTYLGWLIPWAMPLTLLGESPEQIREAQRQLIRIGIDRPSGAAHGTIETWGAESGRSSYRVATFADIATESVPPTILDVRRTDERATKHIEGSTHIPMHELLERMSELPVHEVLWVHCASGFRASIAASLLDRAGQPVVLIDDKFDNASSSNLELRQG